MDAGPASGRARFDRRLYDRWMAARVPETRIADLAGTPWSAAVRGVRRRALLVSGIGFFTDAYDLFVIGIVSTLLKGEWHLGAGQLALLNAVMLGAAFLGALAFGRLADVIGRTRVYWMSAAMMVLAAVGSALSPSLAVLIAFRFLLGFGVGGDYPVSAVLMSEYAHHSNRGRMIGLVFCAQAVGLVVGPLVALALLGSGAGPDVTWRLLLGLGAIPAAIAVWLRRTMPEPPRYAARPAGGPGSAARSGRARAPDQPRSHADRWPGRRAAGSCSTTPTTATRSPPRRSSASSARTPPRPRRSPSSSRSSLSPPCPATSSRSRGWTGSATAGCN